MPSSDRRSNVYRPAARPKTVFDRESIVRQSFRTFEFPETGVPAIEDDIEALREAAAEARAGFERELEKRVAEAERRGQELALQEAVRIDEAERAKLAERLEGAVEAFHLALDRAEEAATRDALRLGLIVAEQLCRFTLTHNAEALAATLVNAVGKMESEGDVKVVAAPELATMLSERTSEVMGELKIPAFDVESDDTLQPGDIMIYRGNSSIDARVATRIRKLERSLLEELGLEAAVGDEE